MDPPLPVCLDARGAMDRLHDLQAMQPRPRPRFLRAERPPGPGSVVPVRLPWVVLAAGLLLSSAVSVAEERVTVVVLPLAEASGRDQTPDLTELRPVIVDPLTLTPGDKIYVEAWCQSTGPRGITTAVIDLTYDTAAFDTSLEQVSLSPQWELLAFTRSVNDEIGLVDNLGGNNLSGPAAAPNWARIGTVEFDVTSTPATGKFCSVFAGQSPAGFPLTFAILQEGTVEPGDVAYGCAALGCMVEADCGDPLFCNGAEVCSKGICVSVGDPCIEQWCDEGANTCRNYGNGDFDSNGRLDLRDAAEAQVCFGEFALPDCEPANLTGDGFIGLHDFARLLAVLTGP